MSEKSPQERIKDAAIDLFGDKGYKATTIRDICKKANVSLALVNYHFKNKDNLYQEILFTTVDEAFSKNPITDFVKPNMQPEEKLRNAIRLLLHRILGKNGLGKNQNAVRLMAKELTSPSPVLDIVYQTYITKMIEVLGGCIRELAKNIDKETELRLISSIAGQCLHPLLAKEILNRAGLYISSETEDLEKHAEHIFKFSINGIKAYQ